MRNVRVVYRVEFSRTTAERGLEIPMGPYTYLKIKRNANMLNQRDEALIKLVTAHEPYGTNPRKERLSLIGLFSTFIDARPGPREDPYLRDFFCRTLKDDVSKYRYGFDSMAQLDRWFFCSAERLLLSEIGFVISSYYVRNVKLGLRQVLFHENDIQQKKQITSLI